MRIQNITTGYWLRPSHADRAIAECSACWVEYGKTIRNLTLTESIAARNEQARMREPLEMAELHGVRYEPAEGFNEQHNRGRQLAFEANKFAAGVV